MEWIFLVEYLKRFAQYEKNSYFCVTNFLAQRTPVEMKKKVKTFTSKRILGLTAYQIIILAVLIVMLFFFSDSSVTKRIKYETQINNLESQIEFYRQQTETEKEKLNELQSNKDDLEKFARENYLMKKENEDIFIID